MVEDPVFPKISRDELTILDNLSIRSLLDEGIQDTNHDSYDLILTGVYFLDEMSDRVNRFELFQIYQRKMISRIIKKEEFDFPISDKEEVAISEILGKIANDGAEELFYIVEITSAYIAKIAILNNLVSVESGS